MDKEICAENSFEERAKKYSSIIIKIWVVVVLGYILISCIISLFSKFVALRKKSGISNNNNINELEPRNMKKKTKRKKKKY